MCVCEMIDEGETPNPDVLCNRHIKFGAFAGRYLEGYDYIATGHYCGIHPSLFCGSSPLSRFSCCRELVRGVDEGKDQSYFLSQISGDLLPRILFPLYSLKKRDVKLVAKEIGLHVFDKPESMGICFIGERNMRSM